MDSFMPLHGQIRDAVQAGAVGELGAFFVDNTFLARNVVQDMLGTQDNYGASVTWQALQGFAGASSLAGHIAARVAAGAPLAEGDVTPTGEWGEGHSMPEAWAFILNTTGAHPSATRLASSQSVAALCGGQRGWAGLCAGLPALLPAASEAQALTTAHGTPLGVALLLLAISRLGTAATPPHLGLASVQSFARVHGPPACALATLASMPAPELLWRAALSPSANASEDGVAFVSDPGRQERGDTTPGGLAWEEQELRSAWSTCLRAATVRVLPRRAGHAPHVLAPLPLWGAALQALLQGVAVAQAPQQGASAGNTLRVGPITALLRTGAWHGMQGLLVQGSLRAALCPHDAGAGNGTWLHLQCGSPMPSTVAAFALRQALLLAQESGLARMTQTATGALPASAARLVDIMRHSTVLGFAGLPVPAPATAQASRSKAGLAWGMGRSPTTVHGVATSLGWAKWFLDAAAPSARAARSGVSEAGVSSVLRRLSAAVQAAGLRPHAVVEVEGIVQDVAAVLRQRKAFHWAGLDAIPLPPALSPLLLERPLTEKHTALLATIQNAVVAVLTLHVSGSERSAAFPGWTGMAHSAGQGDPTWHACVGAAHFGAPADIGAGVPLVSAAAPDRQSPAAQLVQHLQSALDSTLWVALTDVAFRWRASPLAQPSSHALCLAGVTVQPCTNASLLLQPPQWVAHPAAFYADAVAAGYASPLLEDVQAVGRLLARLHREGLSACVLAEVDASWRRSGDATAASHDAWQAAASKRREALRDAILGSCPGATQLQFNVKAVCAFLPSTLTKLFFMPPARLPPTGSATGACDTKPSLDGDLSLLQLVPVTGEHWSSALALSAAPRKACAGRALAAGDLGLWGALTRWSDRLGKGGQAAASACSFLHSATCSPGAGCGVGFAHLVRLLRGHRRRLWLLQQRVELQSVQAIVDEHSFGSGDLESMQAAATHLLLALTPPAMYDEGTSIASSMLAPDAVVLGEVLPVSLSQHWGVYTSRLGCAAAAPQVKQDAHHVMFRHLRDQFVRAQGKLPHGDPGRRVPLPTEALQGLARAATDVLPRADAERLVRHWLTRRNSRLLRDVEPLLLPPRVTARKAFPTAIGVIQHSRVWYADEPPAARVLHGDLPGALVAHNDSWLHPQPAPSPRSVGFLHLVLHKLALLNLPLAGIPSHTLLTDAAAAIGPAAVSVPTAWRRNTSEAEELTVDHVLLAAAVVGAIPGPTVLSNAGDRRSLPTAAPTMRLAQFLRLTAQRRPQEPVAVPLSFAYMSASTPSATLAGVYGLLQGQAVSGLNASLQSTAPQHDLLAPAQHCVGDASPWCAARNVLFEATRSTGAAVFGCSGAGIDGAASLDNLLRSVQLCSHDWTGPATPPAAERPLHSVLHASDNGTFTAYLSEANMGLHGVAFPPPSRTAAPSALVHAVQGMLSPRGDGGVPEPLRFFSSLAAHEAACAGALAAFEGEGAPLRGVVEACSGTPQPTAVAPDSPRPESILWPVSVQDMQQYASVRADIACREAAAVQRSADADALRAKHGGPRAMPVDDTAFLDAAREACARARAAATALITADGHHSNVTTATAAAFPALGGLPLHTPAWSSGAVVQALHGRHLVLSTPPVCAAASAETSAMLVLRLATCVGHNSSRLLQAMDLLHAAPPADAPRALRRARSTLRRLHAYVGPLMCDALLHSLVQACPRLMVGHLAPGEFVRLPPQWGLATVSAGPGVLLLNGGG